MMMINGWLAFAALWVYVATGYVFFIYNNMDQDIEHKALRASVMSVLWPAVHNEFIKMAITGD